jgi:hypothetical protein
MISRAVVMTPRLGRDPLRRGRPHVHQCWAKRARQRQRGIRELVEGIPVRTVRDALDALE